jgi:cell division protein ZapA (FtsZ GTPase activity inhibitor)
MLIVLLPLAVAYSILAAPAKGQVPLTIPQYLESLRRPNVRRDLGIDDVQLRRLQELTSIRSTIVSTTFAELRLLEAFEDRRRVYEAMQREVADVEQSAYDLLLPMQQKRVDQIVSQMQIRASSPSAGLTHKRIVAELNLSERDLQLIRAKTKEVETRLQERLKALQKDAKEARESAHREVLGVLSEEQRRKYHDLIGELVDLTEPKDPAFPQDAGQERE